MFVDDRLEFVVPLLLRGETLEDILALDDAPEDSGSSRFQKLIFFTGSEERRKGSCFTGTGDDRYSAKWGCFDSGESV